jgi:hypothetical protein
MPRGRPAGSKNSPPAVQGFHTDRAEAVERGISVQQLKKHARYGVGPLPIKVGQQLYYRDGGFAAYLEALYRQRNEPRVVRRGRPSAPHATA